jgi:hypothetical protein
MAGKVIGVVDEVELGIVIQRGAVQVGKPRRRPEVLVAVQLIATAASIYEALNHLGIHRRVSWCLD